MTDASQSIGRLTSEPDPQLDTIRFDGDLPRVMSMPGQLCYSDEGRASHTVISTDEIFIAFNGYRSGMRTRAHVHPRAREIYCVLEGAGHFTHEGEVKVLRAGDWLHAAPGEAHGVYNPGPDDLGFLIIVAPRIAEHMWMED